MKKSYLILNFFSILILNALFAQGQSFTPPPSLKLDVSGNYNAYGDPVPSVIKPNGNFSSMKTQTPADTGGIEFMQDNVVYLAIGLPTGGVLPFFGTNPFYEKEFAQIYPYFGGPGFDIETILIPFWAITDPSGKSINIKVYNTSNSNPSTTITTQSLSISDIDSSVQTPQYTVVNLSSPVTISAEFAVGCDVSNLLNTAGTSWTGGLVAVWGTAEGEPHLSYLARIKASSGWLSLSDWSSAHGVTYTGGGAPSNSNVIILPVVTGTYNTGISEVEEINGIKLTQSFPNPSKDYAKIEYQIKEAADVKLELIDMTGKIVLFTNEGIKAAGKHEISLNVSGLAPGNYFYSLSTGEKRLTKKMTIH